MVELPPNGQGLTALVLLNILEHFDIARSMPLGPERLHLALEAARIAFAVRDTHIADPRHMRVAGRGAARQGFRQEARGKLDRSDKRVPLPKAPTPGSDTVYLTVVDRDRTRGVADQFALLRVRHRHLHREDRHHAATIAARVSCSSRIIRT